MTRILTTLATTAALLAVAPIVAVRGAIALRTNYRTNCEADAWMSADLNRWAEELRRAS